MRVNFSFFHSVCTTVTVWKNGKFSLTEKKFRQINYLVISLVKPLLSRNFCEKSVRENSGNFHTVALRSEENEKFTLTKKIFRQINYLVISLVKMLLSRNFCQKSVRVNFLKYHTVKLQLHEFFTKNA